jgi:hypothetical protein
MLQNIGYGQVDQEDINEERFIIENVVGQVPSLAFLALPGGIRLLLLFVSRYHSLVAARLSSNGFFVDVRLSDGTTNVHNVFGKPPI